MANNYKGHYYSEGVGEEDSAEAEGYQCPETGAHFKFETMCRLLKKVQSRRQVLEKTILKLLSPPYQQSIPHSPKQPSALIQIINTL